ncbi:hypothetical protein BKH43_01475 [Helicobacter sp. 13S00401-1]|uniref:hypothetical protein n=1 Tax=Helicobacter sp. 13S00401-1 TaxID=1905758 RepID=UPI000BA561E3|nr:hypothetical protein [Helicobacter sp. 13S00401-1]PAF51336.1 hypothetical protein BKH43_01475 [Helicobacter sp. 13S00401-1]
MLRIIGLITVIYLIFQLIVFIGIGWIYIIGFIIFITLLVLAIKLVIAIFKAILKPFEKQN